MNILDALKQLRDDIKAWVTNNLNAVNAKIDQKTVQIDNELNDTSTNPVQNKVITAEIGKINSSLITKEYVDEQIANIKPSDDLATKEYVDEQIANVGVGKKAEKTYVDEEIGKVADNLNSLENKIGYVATDDRSFAEVLDERLTTTEEKLTALDTSIGYAPTTDGKTLVEKIEEFYATKEEVEGVSKTVSNLSTSTDSRLEAIEAQIGLGGGDSETGSATEQLAAHALTLEDHEGRIAAIEEQLDAALEGTLVSIEELVLTMYDNGDEGEY